MKVKNFKGRINQRRIQALERLGEGKDDERKILMAKIMPQEQAKAIRTKRDRRKEKK